MSSENQKEEIDWANFKFPSRSSFPDWDEKEVVVSSDEGEKESGEGEGTPSLIHESVVAIEPLPLSYWEYNKERLELINVVAGKRINLMKLDTPMKIVQISKVMKGSAKLSYDSFMTAIRFASKDCFGCDLGEIMTGDLNRNIDWQIGFEIKEGRNFSI